MNTPTRQHFIYKESINVIHMHIQGAVLDSASRLRDGIVIVIGSVIKINSKTINTLFFHRKPHKIN